MATLKYDATTINFISWVGRPQQSKKVIEYTTRLGGSQLIISNIKNEASPTQVVAMLAYDNLSNNVEVAIEALEAQITILRDNIGKRAVFTDEVGITISRLYVMDFQYTIKAVAGGADALATLNMTVLTDIAPSVKK